MANFNMTGLDDVIRSLSSLADSTGKIAKEAIDAASPRLKESLSQRIEESADRGYATGELAGSVKATRAKQGTDGYFAEVKPTGTDKKGVRNGEKLAYLEYGTSRQAAHPVMTRAVNAAREECEKIMQEKIGEAIGRLV